MKNQEKFIASTGRTPRLTAMTLMAALLCAPLSTFANDSAKTIPPCAASTSMDHSKMSTMDHSKMSAMDHSMMTGMNGMGCTSNTGDVDYDFSANMRMHHQMAVMMSEAQLKNGKNAEMRSFASRVIAAQKKEIAELDRWLAMHKIAGK